MYAPRGSSHALLPLGCIPRDGFAIKNTGKSLTTPLHSRERLSNRHPHYYADMEAPR